MRDRASQPYQLRVPEGQRRLWEAAAAREGRALANWMKWTCSLAAISPAAREAFERSQRGERITWNGSGRYFQGGNEIAPEAVRELIDARLIARVPIPAGLDEGVFLPEDGK